MAIETRCRRCGAEFEPDHEAIMAGRWRLCGACRDRDEAEAERLLSDERAARKARPRDWWAAERTVRRRKAG